MNTSLDTNESKPLEVRRGRVASVDLYEIKDSELDILENGTQANIQLNFAIFLLSLAFSSIATLCTAIFKEAMAQTVFLLVAIVGILMGAYLLLCWWKTRKSITVVVKGIRNRIEVPPVQTTKKESSPASRGEAPPDNEPLG